MGVGEKPKQEQQPWQVALRRGAYHAVIVFGLSTLLSLQLTDDVQAAALVGGVSCLSMLAARAGVEGWVDQRGK